MLSSSVLCKFKYMYIQASCSYSTYCNCKTCLFLTWKSVFMVLSWLFAGMYRAGQHFELSNICSQLSSKTTHCLLISALILCHFNDLLSAVVFFRFLCAFCWWFRCLRWPPRAALKCFLVVLSITRLWYVLTEKYAS